MPFTDYIVPQNTGNVNPLGFIFLAFAHTERQRRFEKYAECQQLHRLQRQRLQIQRGRKELLAVPHPCGLRMQCRTVHLLRQFRKETLIGKKQKKRKERAAEIFCRPLSYDRSLHQKCLNNIKVGDASHTPFQEEKVMLFLMRYVRIAPAPCPGSQLVRRYLVDAVVQPVVVEQIGRGRPVHVDFFAGFVGKVAERFLNGQTLF